MKIFLGLLVCILLLVGCTNQTPATLMPTPTPIPTPPIPTPIIIPTNTPVPTKSIDERTVLIDVLRTYNRVSNTFYAFLSATTALEWLEGSTSQKSYVHTLVTIGGLNVYAQTVILWNPPEGLKTYDVLMEMKEAELYRIKAFTELLQILQDTLNTGDVDQINQAYENLETWSNSPENNKSLDIQTELLRGFGIPADEVDFNWEKPEGDSKETPSVKKSDGNL